MDKLTDPKAILAQEKSMRFDELADNRLIVGYHEYGPAQINYEKGLINAIDSMSNCLHMYKLTGNKKYLVDMKNFAMLEFMYPRHPDAHENFGDSAKSATEKKMSYRDIEAISK